MSDATFTTASLPILIGWLVFGYLLGSIPFGLLLTRAAGLGDVRSIGSGNIGATNVLRTGNKGLAALTLLLDALKGTAAIAIALYWGVPAAIVAGFGAFLGHLFPVWLGFKGGKGVATYMGVCLGFAFLGAWQGLVTFIAAWLAVAILLRYSSLAALIAIILVPIVFFVAGFQELALVSAIMSLIVIARHRANISRLLAGTESRIGSKG
ncbi:glycerol-3-phosphate 1-O-acyltransferase PlsY [Mesorhizobium sp. SB112]|uniref:glycerol-3-phosphate 1-O-acyltransferase PlsY n=1 Tax=Mesorhizobium sp. SB112 TaxID=3151853 RepID=UPI0032660C70